MSSKRIFVSICMFSFVLSFTAPAVVAYLGETEICCESEDVQAGELQNSVQHEDCCSMARCVRSCCPSVMIGVLSQFLQHPLNWTSSALAIKGNQFVSVSSDPEERPPKSLL